jgi:hypothetical protein
MEQQARNNDSTMSDPLPIVPCTPYFLFDRLASGLLGFE